MIEIVSKFMAFRQDSMESTNQLSASRELDSKLCGTAERAKPIMSIAYNVSQPSAMESTSFTQIPLPPPNPCSNSVIPSLLLVFDVKRRV
jgi:hypothetical protein